MDPQRADRIVLQFVTDTIASGMAGPLSIDTIRAIAALAERVEAADMVEPTIGINDDLAAYRRFERVVDAVEASIEANNDGSVQ